MSRILSALALGLIVTPAARADLPPPKGTKLIPVENKITTAKDYPEYAFYTVSLLQKEATPVKLDSNTPLVFTPVYRSASLVAVPKNAGKSYGSEKDFLAALAKGKVDGM